ncbi:unnamed protein product [Trichogramma brassicae]|uniref:Reverse transcriptase domain-containing protein n=1 Tax=Trichogramma brassicae TaxID=86971 RepID=A0A6H5IWL9_9HYME|nr:unnamed protein product [Trichogramma brassicae]
MPPTARIHATIGTRSLDCSGPSARWFYWRYHETGARVLEMFVRLASDVNAPFEAKNPFFDENNFLGRYGALKNLEKFFFCGVFSSKSKKESENGIFNKKRFLEPRWFRYLEPDGSESTANVLLFFDILETGAISLLTNTGEILIVACYRSPTGHNNITVNDIKGISEAVKNYDKFIVVGDFNAHHPFWGDDNSCANGQQVVAVFLDIKGAYNSVIPNLLLKDLAELNIPPELLKFFQKLLVKRTLIPTNLSNPDITEGEARKGLPQGSCLSPTLWSIYTKFIKATIGQRANILEFADDIVIYTKSKNISKTLREMEEEVNNLHIKLKEKNLQLAPQKFRSENHTHKRAPDAGAKAQLERMMAPEARTTLTR